MWKEACLQLYWTERSQRERPHWISKEEWQLVKSWLRCVKDHSIRMGFHRHWDTQSTPHPRHSPLLTCSPMIKGKSTHTSLYLLPFPLSVSFHFYPSLLHISYSFSLSLYCTQAQHGSGCNHRWTQFQGQFKDYLLSSVNKSTDRLTLWMFIWNLMDRALNASQLVYSRRDSLLSFSFVLVLSEGEGYSFQVDTYIFGRYIFSVEKKKHSIKKMVSRTDCWSWHGISDN